jgi:RHS repeat-associated protein
MLREETFAPGEQSPFHWSTHDLHAVSVASVPDASGAPAHGDSPEPSRYPLLLFERAHTEADVEADESSGVPVVLQSTESIAPADVDKAGNALRTTISRDTAGPSYVVTRRFDHAARCKSCPLEELAEAGPTRLYHRRFHYDPEPGAFEAPNAVDAGHLCYVEEEAAAGLWEIGERTAYNADFTVTARRRSYDGPFSETRFDVTTTYRYDGLGLDVVQQRLSDGATTLVTDTPVEADTGWQLRHVGPYLDGQQPGPTREFLRDVFFRTVAVARAPSTPTTVRSAVHTIAYRPAACSAVGCGLGMVRTTVFATALDLDGGAVPDRDDAMVTVAVHDGAGREVQLRRRLGAQSPAPAATFIEQHLGPRLWLVEASVFDGAGRRIERLEPYYSTSGDAFDFAGGGGWDSTALPGQPLHSTAETFDSRGRSACTIYRPIDQDRRPGFGVPACNSHFAEDAGYARATRKTYGGATDIGGRPFHFVATVPDWLNTAAPRARAQGVPDSLTPPAMREYHDASKSVHHSRDSYGNFTQTLRDALGRSVGAIRWAGGPESNHARVASAQSYDGRGRVVREDDDSSGTRHHLYLPTGELAQTIHVALHASREQRPANGQDTFFGSLGRPVRRTSYRLDTAAKTIDDDLVWGYDAPYAGGRYSRVAGRAAWVANRLSTIAYGYDDDGRQVQRDVWFRSLAGSYSVQRAYRNDGALIGTAVSGSGIDTTVVRTHYDSASRLARVEGAGPQLWIVRDAGDGSGGYDALGRAALEWTDDAHVETRRSYSRWSGELTSQWIGPRGAGASPIFEASGFQWLGTRLAGFQHNGQDEPAPSAVQNEYDDDGRLARSRTTAGGDGTLARNWDDSFSHFLPGTPLGLGTLQSANGVAYRSDPASLDRIVGFGADSFEYDDVGRGLLVAQRAGDGRTRAFRHDSQGRLTGIDVDGTQLEQIEYDAEGRLARRALKEETRFYLGDDLTLALRGGATVAWVHAAGSHRRIASYVQGAGSGTNVVYLHRDRQGSVVATTTNTGPWAWLGIGSTAGLRFRHGPYGDVRAQAGQPTDLVDSELAYSGALQLSEGLLHLRSRVYSPAWRRFLEPDTVDLLRYTYVNGDPVNFIDPSGRDAMFVDYPQYKIDTETFLGKVGGLGHAGVLLIFSDGRSRYFEYGRYAPGGIVRQQAVPDVKINDQGMPTQRSFANQLQALSKKAGHGGSIEGAYFSADDSTTKKMLDYAMGRLKQNNNPSRPPYSLRTNNCGTFASKTIEAGVGELKSSLIPSPNAEVKKLEPQAEATVKFDPKKKDVKVEENAEKQERAKEKEAE